MPFPEDVFSIVKVAKPILREALSSQSRIERFREGVVDPDTLRQAAPGPSGTRENLRNVASEICAGA
jgi:hypothetical protein